MTTNTYTLELPATKETLNQLVAKLCAENEPDARVTLVLGTCSLVCMDPADRREFGTLVKQMEAVFVLWNSLRTRAAILSKCALVQST